MKTSIKSKISRLLLSLSLLVSITLGAQITLVNNACVGQAISMHADPADVPGLFKYIQWALDPGFTIPIPPQDIIYIGNNNQDITVKISQSPTVYYARSAMFSLGGTNYFPNGNLVVTPYPLPTPAAAIVQGEGATYCGNNAVFSVTAPPIANIDKVFWYSNINISPNNLLKVTNNGELFDYDISNLPTGSHKLFYVAVSSKNCSANEVRTVTFTKTNATNIPVTATIMGQAYVNTNATISSCFPSNIPISLSTSDNPNQTIYEWFTDSAGANPLTVAGDGSYFTYIPTSPGTTVFYYRPVRNGCRGNMYSVTLNSTNPPSNLSVIQNGKTFCDSEQIILTAGANNATSFVWSKDVGETQVLGTAAQLNLNSTQWNYGTNTLYVRALNGNCSTSQIPVNFSVSTTPSNISVKGNLTSYCIGNPVLITPTATGYPAFEWSVDPNFASILGSDFVDSSGRLSYLPTTSGNYTFYVRARAGTACFSNVITVTFNVTGTVSGLTITPSNPSVCKGSPITFTASAVNGTSYTWTIDPQGVNVIGNSSILTIDTNSYPVGQNTVYLTVGNGGSCNLLPQPVAFTITAKPSNLQVENLKPSYCTGEQILVKPSVNYTGLGTIIYEWSTNSNFTNILGSDKVDTNGNLRFIPDSPISANYYLRAKTINGCFSETVSVAISVYQQVSNLVVIGNNEQFCNGQNITLQAGANNATSYTWYKNQGGTIPIGSAQTLNLSPGSYSVGKNAVYVRATNSNGCSSDLLPVTFIVNETPTGLFLSGNQGNYCTGSQVLITPSASTSGLIDYQWSTNPNFTTLLGPAFVNGNGQLSFTATSTGTFTYYVRAVSGSCYTDTSVVTFTVNSGVSDLSVDNIGAFFCQGSGTPTFTANATNATTYTWYRNSNATGLLGTGQTFTPTESQLYWGANLMYVQASNSNGCQSKILPVAFQYNSVPQPQDINFIGIKANYCIGNNIFITPNTIDPGDRTMVWQWSTSSNFSNILGNDLVDPYTGSLNFTAAIPGTYTYYVRVRTQGPKGTMACYSATKLVTFSINNQVSDVQTSPVDPQVCFGQPVTISASAQNATSYTWFSDPTGTNIIGTTPIVTITSVNYQAGTNIIYLLVGNGGTCNETPQPVKFTVNAVPTNLVVSGNQNNYCLGSTVLITPDAYLPQIDPTKPLLGLTYEWSTSPNFTNILSAQFVDVSGRLNFKPTSPGTFTYYVRAKNHEGSCIAPNPVTVTFTVVANVTNISITGQNQSVCFGSSAVFSASAQNASSYIWSTDALGVNILGSLSTITLDPNKYHLGPNTIYLTVGNAGGCNAEAIPVNFNVTETPTNLQVTGNKPAYCTTEQILIEPSATGGSPIYQWSSNQNFTNILGANFVDANGNLSFTQTQVGNYTYYVRAVIGSCYSAPIPVSFAVTQGVTNVQVTNNGKVFCQGENISFLAGSPNATSYNWYKFSNGTGLIATGATYSPAPTDYNYNETTTVYLVASNGTGCSSAAIPITYTVNAAPQNLTVSGNSANYCFGSPVFIQPSATPMTAVSFEWSTNSGFTTLLGSTFVDPTGNLSYTPSASGNFTFYVRAKSAKGCYSSPQTVTFAVSNVVSNVTVTGQNQSVCFGSSAVFSASAQNATSYTWSLDMQGVNVIGNSATLTLDQSKYAVGMNVIYLTVGNAGGCNATAMPLYFTVTMTPTNLQVTGNKPAYCTTEQIFIEPSAAGGSPIYQWSSNQNFTNILGANFVDANGNLSFTQTQVGNYTYYVRAVIGSCYSAPIPVSFAVTQGVTNVQVTNNGKVFCQGENISFLAGSPNATSYNWYKFSNGTGLIATGATYSPAPTDYNYNETTTVYLVASNGTGCSSAAIPITYTVNAAPQNLTVSGNSANYCFGSPVFIQPSATPMTAVSFEWSTNSGFTTLLGSTFVDPNGNLSYTPSASGNFTFYVRAKSAKGCYSSPQTVTFAVSNVVSNVTVTGQNQSVCFGSSAVFSASAQNASSYIWSTDALGVNILGSLSTITLDPNKYHLGPNTIYLTVGNAGGCNAEAIPVNFNVTETPTNLQVTGNKPAYCTTEQILIEPSATGGSPIYQWSSNQNFTNILGANFVDANGNLSFTQTQVGNYTYYVRAVIGSCYSAPIPVSFAVTQGVTNVQVTNNGKVFCQGENISFLAGSPNATSYNWYKFSNGTGLIATGATYSPAPTDYNYNETTTVYLVASNGTGCSSAAIPITYTVNAAPQNLILEGNTTYCVGDTVHIKPIANGQNITYQWSTAINFAPTAILGAGYVDSDGNLSFLTTETLTKTYYVRAINDNGCYSSIQSVLITVYPRPSNVSVSKLTNPNNSSYCQNATTEQYVAYGVNITNYKWYLDSALTQEVFSNYTSGASNNILNVEPGKWSVGNHSVYVVGYNSNGCSSTTTASVSFTIIPGVTVAIAVPNNFVMCKTESTTVTLDNPNGFTVQWYTNSAGTVPYNISLISNNGNTVNVRGMDYNVGQNSIYYRTLNAGGCSSILTPVDFTVLAAPSSLTVTYNDVVCQGSTAVFEAAAQNAGHFEWYQNYDTGLVVDPQYLSGVGNNKLTVPASLFAPGTYNYWVVAVNASGCKTAPQKVPFTVKLLPGNSSISGSTTYCQNEDIHFTLLNAATSTFKWFKDINGLNPIDAQYVTNNGATLTIPAITYSAGVHTLYYLATSSGCNASMQSVAFTVNQSPSNLNVTGNQNAYCEGSLVDIAVGSQGGASIYKWFMDSQGSILVDPAYLTGTMNERFKTSQLLPGQYTLYVKAVNTTGCQSPLLPISFTVNISPAITVFKAAQQTVQQGSPVSFSIAAAGYTQWRVLFNGNVISPTSGGSYNTGAVSSFFLTSNAGTSNQGNYTLEISNGTCSISKDFMLYVLPTINIVHDRQDMVGIDGGETKVILNQHDRITFNSNADSFAYSEQWNYGDGFINSTVAGQHYYNNAGQFNVSLTLTNKQTSEKFVILYLLPILVKPENNVVTVNPGLNAPLSEYTVYPNPFKEFFKVKYTALTGDKITLRIYDLRGVSVFNAAWTAEGTNGEKTFYNPLISAPSAGYILIIVNETQKMTYSTKIIKQ